MRLHLRRVGAENASVTLARMVTRHQGEIVLIVLVPGNSYSGGRISSTVDLLVPTSLDQLLLILKNIFLFQKQHILISLPLQ
jgi:hypothetical protein